MDINLEKIDDILKSDQTKEDVKELTESVVGALTGDIISYGKLLSFLRKFPLSLREQFYWIKFINFLQGIKEPLFGEQIALASKLFGDDETGRKNAMRVVEIIGKIETEESLQFIINATRSCLQDLISKTDYFRIIKAITETLYEDLVFLSNNMTCPEYFKGNMQILALERSGLMLQAGINANEDFDSQVYIISALGRMVDQYAISLENEERYRWHKEFKPSNKFIDIKVPAIAW